MKKNVTLALIIGIVFIIIIIVGLAGSSNSIMNQPKTSEKVPEQSIPEQSIPEQSIPEQSIPEQSIPEQSIPEGKSFILKLNDSVSTTNP